MANKFSNLGGKLRVNVSGLAQIGQGTPREQQILAAIVLPFFVTVAMVAARVLKPVLTDMVPVVGSLAPVAFLIGFVLAAATMWSIFLWVRTGGFGVFS